MIFFHLFPPLRYLLAKNPEKMAKAQEEVDRVLQSRVQPTMADYGNLRWVWD